MHLLSIAFLNLVCDISKTKVMYETCRLLTPPPEQDMYRVANFFLFFSYFSETDMYVGLY